MAWSFDSDVESIVAADRKRIWWLFEIDDTYFWSTKHVPSSVYNAQEYTFKVLPESFSDIEISRSRSEQGVQAPSSVRFTIHNKGNALSASTFTNSTVIVRLIMSEASGTPAEVFAFAFAVSGTPHSYEEKIHFSCEDILQQYLEGQYPNTPLMDSLNPSTEWQQKEDNQCVPEIYGNAYIPIRSVYHTSKRYYVMGESGPTYAIDEVQSPANWPRSVWDAGSFTMTQTTQTINSGSYRCVEPLIANGYTGLFRDGNEFSDLRMKYDISTTVSMTNPADIIEDVLLSFGVPSGVIDSAVSFASAASTYVSWGLSWAGGIYIQQDRRKFLALLLQMCHSVLIVTDKIELHPLSKTSQAIITSADVLRKRSKRTTFRSSSVSQTDEDSGYVAWSSAGEPQDNTIKTLVPAKGSTTDNPSSDLLDFFMVHDSQDVQRLGTLMFQRKFTQETAHSFQSKGTLLGLQPNDVVTINDVKYGASKTALVERIRINKNLVLDFDFIEFSVALDDFTDLSPSIITPVVDDTEFIWDYVYQGPNSTPTDGANPTGFVLGDVDLSNANAITWDGDVLSLNGQVDTVDGQIGGWYVTPTGLTSALTAPTANLVALWKMDETGTPSSLNEEIGNYDATVNGTGTTFVTGKINNAWDLGNTLTAWADPGEAFESTMKAPFTIAWWMKVWDIYGSGSNFIFGGGVLAYASGSLFQIALGGSGSLGGKIYVAYQVDGSVSWVQYRTKNYVIPAWSYTGGDFWHFAVTVDASNIKCYVNGVLAEADTSTALDGDMSGETMGNYTSSFDLWLGNINNNGFKSISGYYSLDDFRIYNKALSASEIDSFVDNPSQEAPVTMTPDDNSVWIGSNVFGTRGIQIEYNAGTPRLYVGDGADHFIKFDGTNFTYTATTAQVTETLTIGEASAHLYQESDGDLVLDNEDGGIQFWTGQASSSGVALALDIGVTQIVTFSNFPILPTADPTTDYQAAHKAYVDAEILAAGGGLDYWSEDSNGHLLPTLSLDQDVGASGNPIGTLYAADAVFTGIPTISTTTPTLDAEVASKKYVDDTVGGTGNSYPVYIEDGGAAIDNSAGANLTLNFDGTEFAVASESNGDVSIALDTIDGGSF